MKRVKRINFNKGLRIDYACSQDNMRPNMQLIHFEKGCMYATNAQIAVRNDLHYCSTLDINSIERLNGKNIHKNTYKSILRYDTIQVEENGIRAFKDTEVAFFPFIEANYPEIEQVINNALQCPKVQLSEIGFNLSNMTILYKSLHNSEHGKFEFTGAWKSAVFRDIEGLGQTVGIIMPINIKK